MKTGETNMKNQISDAYLARLEADEAAREERAFLSSPHTKGRHELFFSYAIQARDICAILSQCEPCDCQVPEEEND